MNIEEISEQIKTQDNLATSLPIFIVQEKRRIYGLNTGYSDDIVWIYDGDEITDENELNFINTIYKEKGENCEELEIYTRTAYIDIWEFVTACFTRKGCEDYIEINRYNLKEPRIYVESGYRNREWEDVRNHLLGLINE